MPNVTCGSARQGYNYEEQTLGTLQCAKASPPPTELPFTGFEAGPDRARGSARPRHGHGAAQESAAQESAPVNRHLESAFKDAIDARIAREREDAKREQRQEISQSIYRAVAKFEGESNKAVRSALISLSDAIAR